METQNLYLTVSSTSPSSVNLESMVAVLKKYCSEIKLKRSDETPSVIEVSFFVQFDDFLKLEQAKADIKKIHSSVSITFMDNTRDL